MSPTPTERQRAAERLSLDRWTAAALDLLMREGVGAVKISRLCRDLGVTKGSFYWHFTDLTDLKEAIATRWCTLTEQALTELAALERLPVRQRLRRMTERLIDGRTWSVERAVRDWARTDERVAASVAASDRHVFGLIHTSLRELGFDPDQARLRTGILVYAGIGFIHAHQSLPKPTMDDVDRLLDILTG